ncbi:MAG: O-antigen ligase family protein [Candidatus Omnitrophica bacterium]|nr:O-antigen ligase family protein [Candidatus Omnitrophota bacterium]
MNSKSFKNILFYGIAGMLVFMPIARGGVYLWSITLALLIEFTLVFLWLWRVNNKESRFERTVLDKPIFAFVLLALISFILSIYKHDSFFALLRLLGYVGTYYVVSNNFDRLMSRRLLILVIGMGAVLSIYGFLQYFGVLNHSWWGPPEFLASVYINHNHFAGYLELVIPMTAGMLFSRRQRSIGYRLAIIAALIIMAIVFIFTQSRGGWICLAISLLVMNIVLIKQGKFNKKSAILFLIIIGFIVSFVYLNRKEIPQRIATMTNAEERETESSMQTRIKIWQGTLGQIRDNPLTGVGIGAFDAGFYRYRPEGLNVRAVFAHNDYLQMAAEMGVLAPFIMLWIFIAVIGTGFTKKHLSPRLLGCAIGILSLSLHGLVDFNFHIPANMLLFSVYAALIMAASKEDNQRV